MDKKIIWKNFLKNQTLEDLVIIVQAFKEIGEEMQNYQSQSDNENSELSKLLKDLEKNN